MRTLQQLRTAVPKHIGLILDGNRRFARRLMMKPWQGHEWGAKKVESVLEWCKELNIHEVTLYCFSIENFHSRPKDEFDYLMNLFFKEFTNLKNDEKLERDQVRITFIGRIWLFPKRIQEVMQELMEKTRNNDKYIINFAMAYGGKAEIVDAAKKIAQQVKEGKIEISAINEDMFSKHLYISSEPQLIIRTGGEKRTSNFLNYQAAYAEWMYVEKMWPEFEKEDFIQCLEEYKNRQRRFGA